MKQLADQKIEKHKNIKVLQMYILNFQLKSLVGERSTTPGTKKWTEMDYNTSCLLPLNRNTLAYLFRIIIIKFPISNSCEIKALKKAIFLFIFIQEKKSIVLVFNQPCCVFGRLLVVNFCIGIYEIFVTYCIIYHSDHCH